MVNAVKASCLGCYGSGVMVNALWLGRVKFKCRYMTINVVGGRPLVVDCRPLVVEYRPFIFDPGGDYTGVPSYEIGLYHAFTFSL